MNEADAERARNLRAAGWTYRQIATEVGCSAAAIHLRLNPAARVRQAEWREANRDAVLAGQRGRYAANPDSRRDYHRAWRKANPEKVREANRKNYEKHKSARQEYDRKRRRENPEESRRARARKLKSVNQRFARSASTASRHAAKNGIPFGRVDLEALCERDGWTCQICFGPVDRAIMARYHPYGMSFDHVVPEAAGGGWTWDNLQLAHRGCNVMRGDLGLEEARGFAREILARLADGQKASLPVPSSPLTVSFRMRNPV